MNTANLVQVRKNNDSIEKTILTNCVKMLTNRKLLSSKNLDKNIEKILNMKPDDFIFKIETKKEPYFIKLMLQNITTVGKNTGVSDFLNSYKDKKGVLIVKSISKAPINLIQNRYPNTEIFLEKDFMIDKVSYYLVPRFEVLSDKEKKEYYEKYNVSKNGSLKISYKDPMVKYYGAKIGDVLRIIRPSETSGFVIAYRVVVKKDLF